MLYYSYIYHGSLYSKLILRPSLSELQVAKMKQTDRQTYGV